MGHKDLMIIFPVVKFVRELEAKYNWGYQFKWDQGSFETRIAINDEGKYFQPPDDYSSFLLSRSHYVIFVPDILEFQNKIIIEIEEESKPQKGPKIRKKGHWEESERDTRRDTYYKKAGFRIFKVWEHELKDGSYKKKLKQFLVDCYLNTPQEMQVA